jgi:tetratricopeptide (TPR) repeat protein
VRRDAAAAHAAYAKAFEANPSDARLLYEFDQLKKRMGIKPQERLAELDKHGGLIEQRDDLSIEHIALMNLTGQHKRALSVLLDRRFSPWEGGEGLVSGQYVEAHTALGRQAMEVGEFTLAAGHFQQARKYPENLGEGKHLLTLERQLDYWEGLALERGGDQQRAEELYRAAAESLSAYSVHSYYRALALRQLGREKEAESALRELYSYAVSHRNQEPVIDYFATSLPNFLLFEDDLAKRNTVDCLILQAYAELGLGHPERAQRLFAETAELEPDNVAAWQEISRLKHADETQESHRA